MICKVLGATSFDFNKAKRSVYFKGNACLRLYSFPQGTSPSSLALDLLNRSVVAIFVDVQGVSSRAMLLTDGALKTGCLQVFGFHVHMYNWGTIGGKSTFRTLIVRVRPSKDMQFDCFFHTIWERKGEWSFFHFYSSSCIPHKEGRRRQGGDRMLVQDVAERNKI